MSYENYEWKKNKILKGLKLKKYKFIRTKMNKKIYKNQNWKSTTYKD